MQLNNLMAKLSFHIFLLSTVLIVSCSIFKAPSPQDQLKEINWYSQQDPLLQADESIVDIFDLDSNGLPDIIAWDTKNSQLMGYMQSRKAPDQEVFSRESITALAQKPDQIAFGDFDHNGQNELAVAFGDPLFSLGLIKKSGSAAEAGVWTYEALPLASPIFASKVLFCDVNSDGLLDLVASNMYSELNGGIRVILLNPEGKAQREIGPTSYHLYSDIAILDFNGDGASDIAGTTIGFQGQLYIWQGDAKGGFKQIPFSCPAKDFRKLMIPTSERLPFPILALTADEGIWGWNKTEDEWIKLEKCEKIYSMKDSPAAPRMVTRK